MRRVVGETGVHYVKVAEGWETEGAVSHAPRGRRDAFPPSPVSPVPEGPTEPSGGDFGGAVPCAAFGCGRMLSFRAFTGEWAHTPEAGKPKPLHRPVLPEILDVCTEHPEKVIIPLEDVEPVAASTAARPTWDNWALGIAAAVAVRADCTRRRVGAVILDSDHRVVSTGYNGYPSGMPGCASAGACHRGRKTYAEIPKDSAYVGTAAPCDALHAEENAVLHAHRSLSGCWIYVTHKPCPNCERLLRGTGLIGAKWPDGYILF